jgi:hypothetical protein
VVINNLNSQGMSVPPIKADAPLIVDADAVLAFAISLHPFQPISWKRRKRSDIRCRVEYVQFARAGRSMALNLRTESRRKRRSVCAVEGPDHQRKAYWYPLNVNDLCACLRVETTLFQGFDKHLTSEPSAAVSEFMRQTIFEEFDDESGLAYQGSKARRYGWIGALTTYGMLLPDLNRVWSSLDTVGRAIALKHKQIGYKFAQK